MTTPRKGISERGEIREDGKEDLEKSSEGMGLSGNAQDSA
jgi:hypothetical protein